uniref:Uncharacterized protein n=1 Tax=Acrobeloides nanus TaxID=290746 RepID=A0A914DKR6_9BILA
MIACDDNGNHTVLVGHNIEPPYGLAVDWIHGLLFWIDSHMINVMDLNSKQRKVLFNEENFAFYYSNAIAVDPSKGLIFWIDLRKGAIERASMDGNDRMTIANVSLAYGIALDIFDERVYWGDHRENTIDSVDYNGNDWKTILHSQHLMKSPSAPVTFSLAIFEEKLYWTDYTYGHEGVFVMNKFNGTEVRQLISVEDYLEPLRVYHNAVQPELPNKCDQHSCGNGAICLPKGNF